MKTKKTKESPLNLLRKKDAAVTSAFPKNMRGCGDDGVVPPAHSSTMSSCTRARFVAGTEGAEETKRNRTELRSTSVPHHTVHVSLWE